MNHLHNLAERIKKHSTYIHKPACFILLFIAASSTVSAQQKDVTFTSSDKKVEQAFKWAKDMALQYRGNPADPSGPWYEGALPTRNAFCMRDISHQCIGGEILGMSRENFNMFNLFVSNISASKDWCSYWEINKWGKPAPEDYRNDNEFWYNLPANFDVLYASWRLYLWTGDRRYINDATFDKFQQKTVNEYVDKWVLAPDSLLNRPLLPNKTKSFNPKDAFSTCRGLPSYSEGIPNLKVGIDLVSALYRAMLTYADILELRGQKDQAAIYTKKAEAYRQHLENDWWDPQNSVYNALYGNDGKFAKDPAETFLLWFDALKDTTRLNKTAAHVATINVNIENTSYYPSLLYKYGRWADAKKYLLFVSDPSTPRREYPEVSYGVIQGVVLGLMGITPDARVRTISTIFRTNEAGTAEIKSLTIMQTSIDINHLSHSRSILTNSGKKAFKWKAMFYGNYAKALVNNRLQAIKRETDNQGNNISYLIVNAEPGSTMDISMKK